MTIEQHLSGWVASAFATAFPDAEIDPEAMSVRISGSGFGDYQCNAAMGLAKVLRMAPKQIAEAIAGAELPEGVASIEVAGPGFINVHLETGWLAARLDRLYDDERLGVPEPGTGKTIVIDYSSPNIAKPMHIAHIRSTVIGNALDRMHRFAGYTVYADNHIGDWGTQFGVLIMGYRNFLDEDALAAAPIKELERVYVLSADKGKEDEDWKEQARQELVKLQQGDPENLALWQKFIELSMQEFETMYQRLGVRFDLVRGESYYNEQLPGVVEQIDAAGLLEESDGAQVVKFEDQKLGVCIVRKRDGGFNYATSDIATVRSRIDDFDPEAVIYVTDERQQLHFRQFFKVCELLGWQANLQHLWFGLMKLKVVKEDGSEEVTNFSSREGNVISLKGWLDEAESRARAMAAEKNPDLSDAELDAIAAPVGMGAVKYSDLSRDMSKLIIFDWETALALNGNSGPYLQYAFARGNRMGLIYGEENDRDALSALQVQLHEELEREVVLKALQFPEAVLSATRNLRPDYLCEYLFELAQPLNTYYQTCRVLDQEPGLRDNRLKIHLFCTRIIRKGLDLLGIDTPERI